MSGVQTSDKERLIVFEANMNAGLRRHYRRTGAELADVRMPFAEKMDVRFEDWLKAEDDGIGDDPEDGIGDYEMRQRTMGVRALFRMLKAGGVEMDKIMQQLFSAGRAVHDEFFSSLTMTESAMMFSRTRAAHSWRCKVISGKIKLAGMKGVRLPGQKTPESSETYAQSAKGNRNRKKKQRSRARQKSFLGKLHVPKQKRDAREKRE